MQEVAVGNYRAFITAADALLAIRQEVSSIDKHLESLIGEVPKLTSGCTEFIDSAENILEKRKMNQALLANHSTLLDLLEIPQLMDTCVRNGNFDEALDLEAFVSKLATLHPKLPVIQALAAEVRQTTQSLLSQLLQKLRSNIQVSCEYSFYFWYSVTMEWLSLAIKKAQYLVDALCFSYQNVSALLDTYAE
jgi:hypothetical protein